MNTPVNAQERPSEALTPYAGTSGWSGSSTSRERAEREDSDGTTSLRQATAIRVLSASRSSGLTWKELAELTGWHHGQASGVLSVLHKEGRIERLAQSRSRCRVYVMPQYVHERDTETQGRKPKDDWKARALLAERRVADAHALADWYDSHPNWLQWGVGQSIRTALETSDAPIARA